MAAKLPRLVLVEWLDPFAGDSGWQTYDQMTKETPSVCYAVGFVVAETEAKLVLSPDYSDDMGDTPMGGRPLTLNKGVIRKVKVLRR